MELNVAKLRERLRELHDPSPAPPPPPPAEVQPSAHGGSAPMKRPRIGSPAASTSNSTPAAAAAAAAVPVVPGLVSVCVPVHNCAAYIDECFESVLEQSYQGPLELSVYDDGSTDGSAARIAAWEGRFLGAGRRWVASSAVASAGAGSGANRGEGYARNRAVAQSAGEWLCVMDADDTMWPRRVERQLQAARRRPRAIVGGGFERVPVSACVMMKGRRRRVHLHLGLVSSQPGRSLTQAAACPADTAGGRCPCVLTSSPLC
jgi:hypothetical protein